MSEVEVSMKKKFLQLTKKNKLRKSTLRSSVLGYLFFYNYYYNYFDCLYRMIHQCLLINICLV